MSKSYIIFSALYLPHLGGVERYTYNLAKKLTEKGEKVSIVTSKIDNLPEFEVIDGIDVYRLDAISLMGGRFPILKPIGNKKLIKDLKANLVIVNTRLYFHSWYGAKFAKKIGAKCITIDHSTDHMTLNNALLDFVGRKYEHFITRRIKHFCKDFYGVSQACNEWLKHFKINATSTVYNAVNIEDFTPILENPVTDFKAKYNLTANDIAVTYTGRLVKEKGILKLIEAIKLCKEKKDNIYLFIAGDGELSDEVKLLANKHIIPLGRLNYEEIISLLSKTDIFCLPTDYPEGFPTSVLEAVVCKCYCITTTAGGSKELIINDDYGVILKENTPEEIAKQILYATDNKELAKSATELAYKRLEENFTWDIVSEKVRLLAKD